jgi:hypothetical protein
VEIARKLGEQLARRHVFFFFKHVDADTVNELVSQFWEPLVSIVLDPQNAPALPEGGFLMLAFFIDDAGTILPQSGGKFIEIAAGDEKQEAQPPGGWQHNQLGASFALPVVTDFAVSDLDYLSKQYADKAAAVELVRNVMDSLADGKRPDIVLEFLVDSLGLEEGVGFESWLNKW